jgi:hypothetical protein
MAKTSVKTEKRASPAEPISKTAPEPEIHKISSSVGSESEKESTIPRLGVPYDTKTGKIVFDGMRPSTREKLKTLIDDDRLPKELGIGSSAVSSADNDALSAIVVNVLYDAIGSIAVILAKNRGFGDHAEILRYTAAEKEQFSAPTLKVLNKYDLLGGKYADELLLIAAVGTVTTGHVMAMTRAAAAMRGDVPPTALGERIAS